jgi:hypothetical protein
VDTRGAEPVASLSDGCPLSGKTYTAMGGPKRLYGLLQGEMGRARPEFFQQSIASLLGRMYMHESVRGQSGFEVRLLVHEDRGPDASSIEADFR